MDQWFNTAEYPINQQILFGSGAILWIIVYILYIRNVLVEKRITIPAFIVCADIAWEFLRGFVYPPDIGLAYVWGYRIWFLMDIIICYGAFVYGNQQVDNPVLKKYFKPLLLFNLIAWFTILYFMIPEYDDHVGLFSAFIINIGISTLYLLLMIRRPVRLFSKADGFCKMTGTFVIGIFGIMHWPQNHFLASMVILTFILDLTYFIILIYRYALVKNNLTHEGWASESETLIPAFYLAKIKEKLANK